MMPSRCCTEINNNCPVGSAVNSAFLTGLFSLYEIFYGFPQFAECFFRFLMCSIGGVLFYIFDMQYWRSRIRIRPASLGEGLETAPH